MRTEFLKEGEPMIIILAIVAIPIVVISELLKMTK